MISGNVLIIKNSWQSMTPFKQWQETSMISQKCFSFDTDGCVSIKEACQSLEVVCSSLI